MKKPARPLALAVVALLSLAAFAPNLSADQPDTVRVVLDFNTTNLPPGISLFDGASIADDGSGLNGCLHLTDPGAATSGHLKISNVGEGMNVTHMQIQWRSLVGGGSGADGYSLNWANDLPKTPVYGKPGEEGAGSGITVTVDTFGNGIDDIVGLELIWKTNVVASLAVEDLRRNTFVDASLTVDENGQATLNYDSHTLTAQLDGWAGITKGDLIISGRTGGLDDRHWIDNLDVHPRGVMPGTYTGLFQDGDNWQHTNSGAINLKVTPKGTYSGALTFGGAKLPFTGQFDPFERTSLTHATPPGGAPIAITLAFSDSDAIGGTISNGISQATISAERLVWNKKTKPATNHLGRYSFAGEANGLSYGTLTVDIAGALKFTGVLADGSKVSQQTFVGPAGTWSLYLPTHAGKGSVQGQMQAVNIDADDTEIIWFKPPTAPGTIYPDGFTTTLPAVISPYTPPAPGERVLPYNFGQAVFTYDGDGLLTYFGLTIKNQFIDLGTNSLTIKLAPKTGLFTGSVLSSSGSLRAIKFGGVILPSESLGVGNFFGTDQSGDVVLRPLEP